MLPDRPDVPGRPRDDNGVVLRLPSLAAGILLAIASNGSADDPPAPAPPGALPAGPQASAPAQGAPGTLAIVDGVVRTVDLAGHRGTLDVNGAPLVLGVDRNTLVYLPTGLSTVFELRPGEVVRAGRNDRFVAYWVQVRSAPAAGTTPSTPGQGTGPGGGAPAPAESPAAPAPSTPTGSVPSASSPGPG